MLPKKYRLKNTKAFDATYKNHKILSDSVMTVYIGREKKDVHIPSKFGFVVSKKYHKRATKRNRIKRLLRECVRLAVKNNRLGNLNKYMSFVIMPKISDKHYSLKLKDIENSFYKLVERIK